MFKIKKDIKEEKEEKKEKKEIKEIKNSLNSKSVLFWGSDNCGKTSLVTIIAKKLADENKHKNVIVVYADENVPPVPYLFAPKNIENSASLGNLYTPIKLTKNYILENLTTLKNVQNLGILGFLMGEYPSLYPTMEEELINNFFDEIQNIFDYVLIDGTTFFNTNQITFNAFENVDTIIEVATQDVKSVAYFKSQKHFLENLGVKSTKTILNKVINNEVFINTNYIFPFCDELKENMKVGNMLQNIKNKEFNKKIDEFIGEIF